MGQGICIGGFKEKCLLRQFLTAEIERDEFLFGERKSLRDINCLRQGPPFVCDLYLTSSNLLSLSFT
jgi:hypothetical protein